MKNDLHGGKLMQEPGTTAPAMGRHNGRWAGYNHLLLARLKELQREPEVIFWIIVFPLLLSFGLGLAFRNKPADKVSVAIVAGPGAERTFNLLRSSPRGLAIHADVVEGEQARNSFRLGKYALVIEPLSTAPAGAADRTTASKTGDAAGQAGGEAGKTESRVGGAGPIGGGFEYRYDPARPDSVLARLQVDEALQSAAGRRNPLATSSRASTEPGARYIDFLIPGLLGMNLMNSGMWGIGFALVEMRQRKLLKRYLGTPMRRSDFLLALSSSRLVLMVLEVLLLLGFGVLFFHMVVRGSLFSILLLGTLGALCFAGLGLLTASRAQKIETISGLINVVMMPMWVFSGVFFSYENFPAAIHPYIRLLPLTALNDALRATILEGAPLSAQPARLMVLGLWGGISFVLALRYFRWV